MLTSLLTVAGLSFAILFLLMCVVWLWFRRIDNAAVVDVGWGNGFAIAAVVSLLLSPGWTERNLLVAALVVFWGERLTLHLLFDRILGGKPETNLYQWIEHQPHASAAFQDIAASAKRDCPLSKALASVPEISLVATLEPG